MEFVTVRGRRIPALGMGTWRLDGDECRTLVEQAMDLGYRHVDTAQIYGNEEAIGKGMRATSVARSDIFLTTKIWNDNHAPDDVRASTEESLRKLGTPYVDLLLLHWPRSLDTLPRTLEAMLGLVEQDKARLVGVSNFTPAQLRLAQRYAPISCNQIEYHPYLSQATMCQLARSQGFVVMAFAPLARGKVLDDPTLTAIGERYGKSPAQVALRWLLEQEQVGAIPKPDNKDQLAANLEVFDFELTSEESQRILSLSRGERLVDPDWGQRDWES